jgi:Bacterial lectin
MGRNRMARRSSIAVVVGVVAVGAAAMGGIAHGALISEGGRGKTIKHPKVWVAPGGHVCLTAGTRLHQKPIRGCRIKKHDAPGKGVVRLGTKAHYSAGALVFNHRIPAVRGFRLTYTQAQWGGSGGDGILVFLQNGDQPMKFGQAFSGHHASYLGYTPRNCCTTTGLPNALAGIALDNYGDFSNMISNGHGCRTNLKERPHIVAVRGPGNGINGYCYVKAGKSVAHMHARTRKAATHKVAITVSPRGVRHPLLTVVVDGKLRLQVNLKRLSPAGYHGPSLKTVKRYRLGFATNTGRVTDNHEIWNIRATYAPTLKVTTTTKPGTFTHVHQSLHYRFVVTNIGGDAVSGIRIHHGAFRLRGLHCAATSLAVGAHTICTAIHRVRVAQASAHRVTDKVWATGIRASGRRDASPRSAHVVKQR